MMDFGSQLERFLDFIRRGRLPTPSSVLIPAEQCSPLGSAGIEIVKENAYFSVRINEIFLEQGRELWAEYDPMVVVLTDFLYGSERLSVPFVVGPNLFQSIQRTIDTNTVTPHGLVYNDILVAGPHPFRGGNFGLTVILYKVKRHNYAQAMLNLLEGISTAVGMPASINVLTKVGGSLLTGLETVLRMQDTVPLLGSRLDFDSNTLDGFVSGYGLLSAEADLDVSRIKVANDRLQFVDRQGNTINYRASDFVLYKIISSTRRGNESTLPFYNLRSMALEATLSGGQDGWERAKSNLLAFYQQAVVSNDVIPAEAEELFEKLKAELLTARDRKLEASTLSVDAAALTIEPKNVKKLNKVAAELHRF
jgi:hypothetical protein